MEVDHHDHEALRALSCDEQVPVGVARFVRLGDDASSAEVAVTLADEWQGRGVGPVLLGRLEERAAAAGITRLVATVLPDNRAATAALRRSGFALEGRDGLATYSRVLATGGG